MGITGKLDKLNKKQKNHRKLQTWWINKKKKQKLKNGAVKGNVFCFGI